MASLEWQDYLVFGAFLLISLVIGIYFALTGGKQKSAGEFISGNRRLPLLPTMLSIVVSFMSAIAILGLVAETYVYGIQSVVMHIPSFIIGIVLAERLFVPWIYRMHLTSVYEYLYMRYQSRAVHLFGVLLGLVSQIVYTGSAVYAPALALEAVTGFDLNITIILMAVVCTIYTAIGGMKAVVITDAFQAAIIVIGLVLVLVKVAVAVGGMGEAFDLANEGGRLDWIEWSPDPTMRQSFWTFVFGFSFIWLVQYGLTQASVQRYSSLENIQSARKTMYLVLLCSSITIVLLGLSGVGIYAYYYHAQCGPLGNREVTSPNQIVVYFVVTIFKSYPGVSGLFMACLFSGAMSSVSSCLSSSAAVCWQDIVLVYKPKLNESQGAIINKIFVAIFGAFCIGVAFLAASLPNVPITQSTTTFISVANGPLGGLFFLGGMFRKANWKGALSGCLTGTVFTLWVGIGALDFKQPSVALPPVSTAHCETPTSSPDIVTSVWNTSLTTEASPPPQPPAPITVSGIDHLYTISYLYYGLFGCIITMVIGLIVSYITHKPSDDLHLTPAMFVQLKDAVTSPFAAEHEDDKMMEMLQSKKPEVSYIGSNPVNQGL